ncbi:MAG: glycerophosphodiester phosphodiesterase [Gemmatimonadota bacterium]|nr:glycerophosphodiester phosphodiesterase [Gemmatimonadota bacterium]
MSDRVDSGRTRREGDDVQDPKVPITIAHRGASGHAPEHTMRSYEMALEMGADYIEQDLQLTADGTLVVIHDDTLDRTVRGPADRCSGPVMSRTADELAVCDAGSWFNEEHSDLADPSYVGLGIPTLRDVFEAFGRTARYYIETKNPAEAPGMEEALIAELERAGLMPGDTSDWTVLVQSFSPESLLKLHGLRPQMPLIQLLDVESDPTEVDLDRIAAHCVGIGPDRTLVTARLIDRAHERGLAVHPWTVNEPDEMERLIATGVDGVFTDFPDRLVSLREC